MRLQIRFINCYNYNNMGNFIEFLIQFGAVGIAFYLIYLINEKDKRITNLIENHLNHNTEMLDKLRVAVKELCIWIKKNNSK